jgi:hypothetical protein
MSVKPDTVTQAQVIDQVKGLGAQKYKLEVQIELMEKRLKLIEASLAENDTLAERVKTLLAESLSLFEDEWNRKTEFYPDIRLASMEQALIAIQPPKKK